MMNNWICTATTVSYWRHLLPSQRGTDVIVPMLALLARWRFLVHLIALLLEPASTMVALGNSCSEGPALRLWHF